jgi:hypothetical protein
MPMTHLACQARPPTARLRMARRATAISRVRSLPSSEVLIFHAQDLPGGPVAKIHIRHRHNTGFHGNWIPDTEIEKATGTP